MFKIFVRIASLRRYEQLFKTYVLSGNLNKYKPFPTYHSAALRILYNSKLSLGTNAGVVTGVHCAI